MSSEIIDEVKGNLVEKYCPQEAVDNEDEGNNKAPSLQVFTEEVSDELVSMQEITEKMSIVQMTQTL